MNNGKETPLSEIMFLYPTCNQELELLRDFISSIEEQGNKNNICFIKNKINTLEKNSLFLEHSSSCPAIDRASTALKLENVGTVRLTSL
jgi:hypothetical protein